jgi:hypothetical protein
MSDKLVKIRSITGKKNFILKEMGYKSFTQANKFYNNDLGNSFNPEQIYEILKDDYNAIIEQLQEEKTKLVRSKKQQLKRYLGNFNLDNTRSAKLKADLGVSKTFKNLAKHQIVKNNDRQAVIYTNFINNAIPIIRKSFQEMGGLKLSLSFELMFQREKTNELTPFYHQMPNTFTINNISEINQIVNNAKTYLINEIPEMSLNNSGWNFAYISTMDIGVSKYKPLKGGSYLELDKTLLNKKCCINIKNTDDKCLVYCILYHIHKDSIKTNADRISNYKQYDSEFDFSKIVFPVKLSDIHKVEDIVDYGINVFGYEKSVVFPLLITKRQDDRIINVLMIGELVGDIKVEHFVYIKNLDVLVMPKQRDANGIHRNKKSHICVNCLHGFCSKSGLTSHRENGCDMFEPVKIEMPKVSVEGTKPSIEFNQYDRKFKCPVAIYADFETLVSKSSVKEHNSSNSSTTKLADLPPCGFAFNVVSDYPEMNLGLTSYRGEDAIEVFLKKLLKCGDKIRKVLDHEKKMIITKEEENAFKKCQVCNICDTKFKSIDIKVKDHCHITGLYRGCCHQGCNVNLNHKNFKIPVYFHNLKGFDGHLIIQGLNKMNFSNIKIIAQNFEKYMTFSFGEFRFLDSFAFMSSSLDTLATNLLKDGKNNFKHTLKNNLTEEQNDLLLSKGVYPYEYMDNMDRFNETKLPSIDEFYSQLSESGITEKDYEHALNVWEKFNLKNMGEYHDLYLKTDVLLLTDVFETFRNTAIKNYKLDPCNGYFTLPNYAWNAMLLKTGVVLDQLTDIDMYLFCEQGIRGGTSMISHRYAKANNKYMESYDPDVVSSYIMYLDANNLYGEAMTQKLPTGGFEWKENNTDILNYDCEGDTGIFVEVDLHYPKELHDLHNNYPLAVESKNILKSELSPYQLNQMSRHNETHSEKLKKLVPNLYDKTNYVCHIKNLQYYVKNGLVITKTHRVLQFKQSAWLKKYIDFNTDQRKLSRNEFEKDMYKLMNNAVFGKTMENMRARVDIQLYTDEKLVLKQIAKPQFIQHKIYGENLIAVKQVKKTCKLDKPIYIGVAVLDLSKLHMYKFHYDYIKPKYGANATLLFTDTDSLCYSVKTDDMYKDMEEDKHLFDKSGYDGKGFRSCDKTNAKVIGKFKDETDGVPIVEFCGLRSKMYSILLENDKEKKTGKGIKKSALKKYVNHEDYKRCLFGSSDEDQRQLVSFNNLRAINHNIGLYRYTKIGLSCSNDKQYLLNDGITSLAYGNKNIPI